MAWRKKCCWKGIADLASNHCLYQWDLEEAKESNSYIKYIFCSEVCCLGQHDNCKAGIFCISCSNPENLSGDFQSDAQHLSFITSELQVMVEILMGKFVKRQELEAACTPLKISKINVLETVNHVATSQIDVGFAASSNSKQRPEGKEGQLFAGFGIQERLYNNACHYCLQDKNVLFITILIQELWCQSQKNLWRCFSRCWTDWLKRSGRLVKKQMLNFLSTESSSLKPRSITTTNLLHTVFPRKDWTNLWVSCLTTKSSMRNCGSHLGSFLHCLMDKLQ